MASSEVHLIERDIDETRARLNGTINRIQDKLTVSGIVDEVLGQAGVPRMESGHDYVLGMLRRHPLPVMVVAAGVGWYMYMRNRRSSPPAPQAVREADVIDVAVLNGGQPRRYDPDLPSRPSLDSRLGLDAGTQV